MVVYGEIGTGKTTLCRAVLDTIEKNVHPALLLNPFLTEVDLLKAILADFGVTRPTVSNAGANKQELINALNEYLLSVFIQSIDKLLLVGTGIRNCGPGNAEVRQDRFQEIHFGEERVQEQRRMDILLDGVEHSAA